MRRSHMHRILWRWLSICRLRLHFRTTIYWLWLHGCCRGVGRLLLGIGVLLGLGGTERDARFDVGVCVGVAGRCGGVVAGADEPEDGGG